jgi:hypothetical protein
LRKNKFLVFFHRKISDPNSAAGNNHDNDNNNDNDCGDDNVHNDYNVYLVKNPENVGMLIFGEMENFRIV